jgi:hypothetical protein
MAPILAVAAGVAATALAGYGLDTRYSIREDISQLRTASKQKGVWFLLSRLPNKQSGQLLRDITRELHNF